MKLARLLGALGRISLTLGILTLLFVAYQLWGTGIHEARAQNALADDFEDALDQATGEAEGDNDPEGDAGEEIAGAGSSTGEAAMGEGATPQPPPPTPAEGEAAARIEIPAIGVDKVVVEGVALSDLKRGPGHFPGTPMPGQPGNAAIAGHRTTYGAPFHRLDELNPGDEIKVTTLQGEFQYTVSEQLIVEPSQVEVLEDYGDNRLTLAACHPKYSAAQRIVVVAMLGENTEPAQAPDRDDQAAEPVYSDLDAGLSGERAGAWPTILVGTLCALIWLAAWALARFVKPVKTWVAYAVGTPVFFIALFYFFEEVSRLLPANF